MGFLSKHSETGRIYQFHRCDRENYSVSRPSLSVSSKASSSPSSSSSKYIRSKETDNRRLQSLQEQSTNNPLMSLNLNLDSLAQIGAASRAQELLLRIQALYQEGYYEASPDVVSYNSVLKAWKEHDQPEKALELLESMMANEHPSGNDDTDNDNDDDDHYQQQQQYQTSLSSSVPTTVKVDVISLNTVVAAFANQGNYPKCIELLRKMQHEDRYPNPDTITYNIVLYSLARSSDRGTAGRAENLLKEMMQQNQEGDNTVSVDSTSFNTCIYAWSKEKDAYINTSGSSNNNGMQTTYSRDSLDAISSASANRALELLNIMEEVAEAGNVNVRPDVYSYTTTIQAFARCREPQQAQDVLRRMTAKGLQPSRITYTALMSAFAKAGDPERAYEILQDMISAWDGGNIPELQPDTVAFSSVIDGWAKVASVDRPDAATEALKLFIEMKRRGPSCQPNSQTYTSLITVMAKCGTEETCLRARELLQEMEDRYDHDNDDDSGGGETIRPTRIHYNAVLNAYAKSPFADKAVRAEMLLNIMKEHERYDCHPDNISYNSLLEACANAFGDPPTKANAVLIAVRTFKTIMSFVGKTTSNNNDLPSTTKKHNNTIVLISPTSTTFFFFAKVCRRHLALSPEKKKAALFKTLQLCRETGMLNHLVVRQVQTACQSEKEWNETAGELSKYMQWKDDFRKKCHNVPTEWTCNARR
ncbi:PPR: pentatricopeptide repeat domain containing protein [Nitzschia inconspicua]|uniref:PPR: pentatricopeptide repeat domain containing protein n=1 Tax=Nitzschia inconspicua TaxID=303405 RepID=A0A9K3PEW5_9STRA|nr:PPR: pentatricopeptide repeat domain containing protein [Nitzschia inconspicua]KAG7344833.1 PPR: pentatricopeptide repeat domain containing protein [Nitzschia inconspicua]